MVLGYRNDDGRSRLHPRHVHLASLGGSSVILTGLDWLSLALHNLHFRPVRLFRFVYSFPRHPPIAVFYRRDQQSNQHEAPKGTLEDQP